MNKVVGGTPKGSQSQCMTCRNARIRLGINMQSEIRCGAVYHDPIVTFPIFHCSDYDDKRIPAMHDMRQIAWKVESRNRGPVGFGDSPELEVMIVAPRKRSDDTPEGE